MSEPPNDLPGTAHGTGVRDGEGNGLSDEHLVRLCAARDRRALELLVRRHQAPVYGFLLTVLGTPDAAADAAAEVFVRAWDGARAFRGRRDVSTWLYQIATACARRAAAARGSAAGSGGQARGRQSAPGAVGLPSALAALGTEDRVVLALSYMANQSCDEMRRVVGGPLTLVRARLARARARLADRLPQT